MGLFDYFSESTPTFSVSRSKSILGTGEANQHTGHIDEGCLLKQGFAEMTHGSLRRVDEFPPAARRALVLSRVSGEYGWAGALGHELLEHSLYQTIDEAKEPAAQGSLLDCNTSI